jgi:anti-sigma B factor antagonist
MSFHIERRTHDGVPILALHGRLVLGEALAALRETLLRILDHRAESGITAVVLDCTQTTYIDSSALGLLVLANSRASAAGGRLVIYGLNRRGLELLVLTKLSTVFQVFDNEIDAVNSCFPDRATRRFDILEFIQNNPQ